MLWGVRAKMKTSWLLEVKSRTVLYSNGFWYLYSYKVLCRCNVQVLFYIWLQLCHIDLGRLTINILFTIWVCFTLLFM
ncbi:MAG TPA: hypothetical protein DD806_07420 [Flavobacterium sp.]|nr:hypothetical protein [Flavobacterium sp.]